MELFTFDRALSKTDLGDMYEHMFIETLEGIAHRLQLSRRHASEVFPHFVDVNVVVLNASEFVTYGGPDRDVASLRYLLDTNGVFDVMNELHSQQGAPNPLVNDDERNEHTAQLFKRGSHRLVTHDGTVYMMVIRPDHISNAHHFLADMAELDKKHVAPALLDLQTMQDLHVMRHLGDHAYEAGIQWLNDSAAEKLLKLVPEGEARDDRDTHIQVLGSEQAVGINRAVRFEVMMNALTHAKGHDAAQQYIDALMFHAIAHGGDIESVTGKLMDVPTIAHRQLRQAYAVYQHNLEGTETDVVNVALLLNDVPDGDSSEVTDQFGLPMERLLELEYAQGMAETLHKLDASFAERFDVKQYRATLAKAENKALLSDFEAVVPFLFHYLEQHAPEMAQHKKLRDHVSRVYNMTAGEAEHAFLDDEMSDHGTGRLTEVQTYALAQHYLEAAQRLMPETFPNLAPTRGQGTDRRLATFKYLMNVRASSTGSLHS